MKHFLKVAFHMVAFALVISLAPSLARAQDPSTPPAPDNTKVNSRNRSQAEPTADQQKENSARPGDRSRYSSVDHGRQVALYLCPQR